MSDLTTLHENQKTFEKDLEVVKQMARDIKALMEENFEQQADLVAGCFNEDFSIGNQDKSPKAEEETNKQKSMWLNVPRFSGENPFVWIAQIQRYFDFFNTSDSQRLVIASFYLDGDALDWYEWRIKSQLRLSWKEFLLEIVNQFDRSENKTSFDNPRELTHNGAGAEYHQLFDELSKTILGVPEVAAGSFTVTSTNSTQEEGHDNSDEEYNEVEYENVKTIDNGEGIVGHESEIDLSSIEHHSLKPIIYVCVLAKEMWHTVEGKPKLIEFSIAWWAEKKVPLIQNIQIPMQFRKNGTNIRWLQMILKNNSKREGSCPTLILIKRYCDRKMVKAKGMYRFIEATTMGGHIGGITLLESHVAVSIFRNSSLPHFLPTPSANHITQQVKTVNSCVEERQRLVWGNCIKKVVLYMTQWWCLVGLIRRYSGRKALHDGSPL